jgi:hypothetical protein
MATETKSTRNGVNETVEAATERLIDLNERWLDASKTVARQYVDVSEQAFNGLADLQERLAKATRVEWVGAVGGAQAKLTRELGSTYTQTARELIK